MKKSLAFLVIVLFCSLSYGAFADACDGPYVDLPGYNGCSRHSLQKAFEADERTEKSERDVGTNTKLGDSCAYWWLCPTVVSEELTLEKIAEEVSALLNSYDELEKQIQDISTRLDQMEAAERKEKVTMEESGEKSWQYDEESTGWRNPCNAYPLLSGCKVEEEERQRHVDICLFNSGMPGC